MKKRGFSLIEIILAISVLLVVLIFVFHFLTTLHIGKGGSDDAPRVLDNFNYTQDYCRLKDDYENISIYKDVDLGEYVSAYTPITSINIFNKNILIVTTNSASTTESDIFLFDLSNMRLIKSIDTGPGINNSILINNYLYVLNNSSNSHIQTFILKDDDISKINDFKINELSINYSMAKSIYLVNTNTPKLIIGSEKNNSGGELFFIELYNHIPQRILKSIEIDGQVNSIYHDRYIYIATANDIELQVFDENGDRVYVYNAPLTLGNGKSVYYSYPYIFLGRTVASFELHVLAIKNNILSLINKYSIRGTLDYIESIGNNYLLITNNASGELIIMNKKMQIIKNINIPARVNTYRCIDESILIANIINNKSHILWLK